MLIFFFRVTCNGSEVEFQSFFIAKVCLTYRGELDVLCRARTQKLDEGRHCPRLRRLRAATLGVHEGGITCPGRQEPQSKAYLHNK